jgi:hypothetical protein
MILTQLSSTGFAIAVEGLRYAQKTSIALKSLVLHAKKYLTFD